LLRDQIVELRRLMEVDPIAAGIARSGRGAR
jgi:hypothetical protein